MILCAYVCVGMVCVCVLGGCLFLPCLCVCVGFEKIDGVVCIVLGDSVARVLFFVLLSDMMFGLCVVGMRVTVSGICSHCLLGVVVCLCLFVLAYWSCRRLLCC